jgi:hypothetical protein
MWREKMAGKVEPKIKTIIKTVNECDPSDFIKHKFHTFCQDLSFEDWAETCPYLFTDEYKIFLTVVEESGCFIRDPDEGDTVNRNKFFLAFSFFVFKAYIEYCLSVASVSKNNMKRFCKKVKEEYLGDNFINSMLDYFAYFSRTTNSDMQKEEIQKMKKSFVFFRELGNMDFIINQSEEDFGELVEEDEGEDLMDDEMSAAIEHVKLCYIYFVEGLSLCFAHFNYHFENMMFRESMNL